MSTSLLKEHEVTLSTLAEHLENSGWDVELRVDDLVLHTTQGLGFAVGVDGDRKFIGFFSNIRVSREFEDGYDLVNALNSEVFLPSFSIDDDNDLLINYQMSFEQGLICGQFMRIVRRFAGMLDHVVEKFDQDQEIFVFRPSASEADTVPNTIQ